LKNIKDYFNLLASKRKSRGITNYYWNEITNYCNYFSHQDSSVLEILQVAQKPASTLATGKLLGQKKNTTIKTLNF